jgi:hypothetical protein
MKLALAILLFILGIICFALSATASLVSTINGNVRLNWGFNTNDDPVGTNLTFNVYCTTNLNVPAAQWPLLTNLVSTAAQDTNDASGTNFTIVLNVPPAQYFFAATASNFWGESSLTTNVVYIPGPPQLINTLKIQKLP